MDPGGRKVGLAVGDDETGVSSPLEIVPYRGVAGTADLLARRAAALGAERIVVGLPTLDSGRETPACARSHALAAALVERGLVVLLQAEHLTTDEARRRAREAGRPRDRPVDDLAAQILLEELFATRRPRPADGERVPR